MMKNENTIKIKKTTSLYNACNDFLKDVNKWIDRVINEKPEGIISDSHDSGTFMTPWVVSIKRTNNPEHLNYLKLHRDNCKKYFTANNSWLDGYWAKQEAHHGPEHFQIFLYTLYCLDKNDAVTISQFEDAAEHIGDWKLGFPEWFNHDTLLFNSLYLGTGHVGGFSLNVPEHFRFCDLCIKTYEGTRNKRYLDFAVVYIKQWAKLIISSENLPIGIDRNGPVFDNKVLSQSSYNKFVGQGAKSLDTDTKIAETYLASGCNSILLNLWTITGEKCFLAAAERLIDTLKGCLHQSIAWQVPAAIREYRSIVKSNRYDQDVLSVAKKELRAIDNLYFDLNRKDFEWAVGFRSDKPDWLDKMENYAPSPILQSLYAEITDDSALMTQSVNLANAYFNLAQKQFGDIATHGCTSRALHSIARGHGRLNGSGVVTEALAPALKYLDSIKHNNE